MKNTYQYLFVLGRNPGLSLAELHQVLASCGPVEWLETAPTFAVASVQSPLASDFMSRLGGTIKMAEVFVAGVPADQVQRVCAQFLLERHTESRIIFGISAYGKHDWSTSKAQQRLGLRTKKDVIAGGHTARLVTSTQSALSAVVVDKNQLLTKGSEIIVAGSGNKLFLARTMAVQPYEAYGERDFGRPGRDSVSGMLPPKLAQIMVNLAGSPNSGTLLDPFCGSGTVLQEAALMGWMELYGSDKSDRAMADTVKNMTWLEQKRGVKSNVHLATVPVEHVENQFKIKCAAIVAEPYLGLPVRATTTIVQLRGQIPQLQQLYGMALVIMARMLAPQGRIVMVWPEWHMDKDFLAMDWRPSAAKAGLQLERTLPPAVDAAKWPLVFQRPDHKVVRQILVLEKSK